MYSCICNAIPEKEWDEAYRQVCARLKLDPGAPPDRKTAQKLVNQTFRQLGKKPQCGSCVPALRARARDCAAG